MFTICYDDDGGFLVSLESKALWYQVPPLLQIKLWALACSMRCLEGTDPPRGSGKELSRAAEAQFLRGRRGQPEVGKSARLAYGVTLTFPTL